MNAQTMSNVRYAIKAINKAKAAEARAKAAWMANPESVMAWKRWQDAEGRTDAAREAYSAAMAAA